MPGEHAGKEVAEEGVGLDVGCEEGVECGGIVGEGLQEEVVGASHGAGVGGVEGEGEGAVEDVGEGLEGCGGIGEIEEKEGCYCLKGSKLVVVAFNDMEGMGWGGLRKYRVHIQRHCGT